MVGNIYLFLSIAKHDHSEIETHSCSCKLILASIWLLLFSFFVKTKQMVVNTYLAPLTQVFYKASLLEAITLCMSIFEGQLFESSSMIALDKSFHDNIYGITCNFVKVITFFKSSVCGRLVLIWHHLHLYILF